MGEVASQKLRATTAGLSAAMSVVFGLTFNTALPTMLDVQGANMGYHTSWLFAGTGTVLCVLVWMYAPEPSARNPAEMDELYEKGIPAWRMRGYVTDVQMRQQSQQSGPS